MSVASLAKAGAFFDFDAGVMFRADSLRATSGRTDVAGSFGRDLGGFDLAFGVRFPETDLGAHKAGLSFGYYGDHVPSWMAELGADLAISAAGKNKNTGAENNVEDYRFRTEEYAIPMSLFYDYEWALFRKRAYVYTGVGAGMTVHVLRTNFSGRLASDEGVSLHYGARTGLIIPLDRRGNAVRLGYEYRRETADTYDPGVRLRYEDRDSHTVSLAFSTTF